MDIEIPDGFTRWTGGPNPAPGKLVLVAMRPMTVGGHAVQTKNAYASDNIKGWLHHGNAGDIVAYKVVNACSPDMSKQKQD